MVSWVLLLFTREETVSLQEAKGAVYKFVDILIASDGDVGDFNKVNAELHEP